MPIKSSIIGLDSYVIPHFKCPGMHLNLKYFISKCFYIQGQARRRSSLVSKLLNGLPGLLKRKFMDSKSGFVRSRFRDRPYMSTTARAPIWVAKLGLKVVDSTYLGGKIRMYDENEKRYR